MAFSKKLINVQFDLANGQFEGGGNTSEVSGLRVSCSILNTGASQGTASIAIWGMPLSIMNQLATVGNQYLKMYENGISVSAGDEETGMSVVWTGAIASAFVDASAMPQTCLRIMSTPGAFQAIKPVPALSISGSADVAGMMSKLAGQMGLTFENNGVSVKLANPYYGGSAWTQALAIARDAGIDLVTDRGTLAILPPAATRSGDTPLFSPETGMMGFPAFNQNNVLVKALFNPALKVAGSFEVQSSLSAACGKWKVLKIEYDLESNMPHGKWDMRVEGIIIGPTTP